MANKQKILVTGGTGFIGFHLVRRLVELGNKVIVFDNDFRGSKDRLIHLKGDFRLVEGDIRDREDVMKASKEVDIIFHLAFINGTRYFYEKPELVLEVGVKGAINTLEGAIKNKIPKYILASSSEVYQQPTHIPTAEKERLIIPDVQNPRYSYAGGKLISELLTLNYLRKSKIHHCIFRPHNIFGPQMGFEHVIPELMEKVFVASKGFKSQKCSIEIQGNGRESRAFCFVEDAVDQIITIYKKGKSGEIYHVGMNHEQTILQLIRDIGKVLKIDIHPVTGELRSGGTNRRCPSIQKVCSLGYKKVNHYLKGLRETVDWYKTFYLENYGKSFKK